MRRYSYIYISWEVGGTRLETSSICFGSKPKTIASLNVLVCVWKAEGCGFIEVETSNSTSSTVVLRQPLRSARRGVACCDATWANAMERGVASHEAGCCMPVRTSDETSLTCAAIAGYVGMFNVVQGDLCFVHNGDIMMSVIRLICYSYGYMCYCLAACVSSSNKSAWNHS